MRRGRATGRQADRPLAAVSLWLAANTPRSCSLPLGGALVYPAVYLFSLGYLAALFAAMVADVRL